MNCVVFFLFCAITCVFVSLISSNVSPDWSNSSQYNSVLNGQGPWLYGHIVTVNHNEDLIASFWDNQFVFGAKVIYFSWRFQIRKKIWRARTSARSARAQKLKIDRKFAIFPYFESCLNARSARGSARAPIFFFFFFFELHSTQVFKF